VALHGAMGNVQSRDICEGTLRKPYRYSLGKW